jgi:hypothetical protein
MGDTLFEAAVRYVDAWRSGPTKVTGAAATRLQALVDDLIRQGVDQAVADERRTHATELAHVSMSEREADAARIADLERRLDDSVRAHGRTIAQRDLLECWSEELHAALGCEHEASNLHDYFACIRHNALTLQSHYESAEKDGARLLALEAALRELDDNDYLQCDGPGHSEQPCETCVVCRARALLPKAHAWLR